MGSFKRATLENIGCYQTKGLREGPVKFYSEAGEVEARAWLAE